MKVSKHRKWQANITEKAGGKSHKASEVLPEKESMRKFLSIRNLNKKEEEAKVAVLESELVKENETNQKEGTTVDKVRDDKTEVEDRESEETNEIPASDEEAPAEIRLHCKNYRYIIIRLQNEYGGKAIARDQRDFKGPDGKKENVKGKERN